MLLQTNSYFVPKDKRVEHARLLRRFRQVLGRIGCDHFEVYEQVGANWNVSETTGRFVQIMRFRDRKHQQQIQAAERSDPGAQALIAEFCSLINFPYQQQQGLFAVGFYNSALPVAPTRVPHADEHGDVITPAATTAAALEGATHAAPTAAPAGVPTPPTSDIPAETGRGTESAADEGTRAAPAGSAAPIQPAPAAETQATQWPPAGFAIAADPGAGSDPSAATGDSADASQLAEGADPRPPADDSESEWAVVSTESYDDDTDDLSSEDALAALGPGGAPASPEAMENAEEPGTDDATADLMSDEPADQSAEGDRDRAWR